MRAVRSTTETSELSRRAHQLRFSRALEEGTYVGTRKAIPVSLPLRAGMTLPTALAAPVEEGMMLAAAPRPPRQSLAEGPAGTS